LTISTTSNEVVAQGNGLTTSFDFSFPVPLASELFVYYTDLSGAITLIPSSQYTVTGIGTANGGAVTYPLSGSPIATGTSLTIQRVVPYVQLTDLVNQSGYYPNVVENALDYLTMQTQQLAQQTALSLQVPFSATPMNLVYPTASARAGKLAGFDSVGNAVAYPISASVGAGNLTSEGPFVSGVNFTPNVTTSLPLSQAYGSAENVQVHFDTEYQGPDQYSLNGTQITFNSAIPDGVQKVYIVGGTTLSVNTPGNGSVGTVQIQDGAVTSAKIAAGAVGATQLAAGSVGNSQLAWGSSLNRVVDSIAALRALSSGTFSRVLVTGYYAVGDRGGGEYYLDPTDTTSADNGGTIIVATDGARWKLIHRGVVYVEQFGAKGDGTTDDSTAILAALASAAGTVKLSNKAYRASQTIAVPPGKALHGAFDSGASGGVADSFPLIFGDLSVTPIISVSGGAAQESVALKNIIVNRATGTVPAGSIGVAVTNSLANLAVEDVTSLRSAIGFSVGAGTSTSLGLHFLRCYTGQITQYHVQISNVVEAIFTECRFGRNGGLDVNTTAYVNISGTAVDTIKFQTTQFNQAGGTAGAVIYFTNYSDANGIISIDHCHCEQFSNFLSLNSSSVRRLRVANTTADTGAGNIFFNGPSGSVSELMLVGNAFDGGGNWTLDQHNGSVISGNYFGGPVLINAGTQVVTGNYFVGAVTLQGATSRTVFVGHGVAGGLGNTMTGTTVIANNG
jgi:hypothetical protein